MKSSTLGYVYIVAVVILLCVGIFLILNNNIAVFVNDRLKYIPPRYQDLCSSNLYAGGPTTQPNYSAVKDRTYWNTDKLLKITKNKSDYSRTCESPTCSLTPTTGSRLLVYDLPTKSLANSYDNELRTFKYYDDNKYLYSQPLKENSIPGRNPYSLTYPTTPFNAGTGENGYVVTEEECMNSCKDDCLGYFMIPDQFKNSQPFCLHVGINAHAVDESDTIDLEYSCKLGQFSSPLNVMVKSKDIYGRIKTNNSPLLFTQNAENKSRKITVNPVLVK